MNLSSVWLIAALTLAGSFATTAVAAGNFACPASSEVAGTLAALPSVAGVLKPKGVLHILAIGSATMFGPTASLQPGTITREALDRGGVPTVVPSAPSAAASELAFPFKAARALEADYPGLKVDVTVRGGRGITAADMLELLKANLKPGQYQLVIWQTGTVEAVRNTSSGDFAEVLAEGATEVEQAGANLVLVDPQYSRFLQTNSNLDPYFRALQKTAALPGVVLFRRFDLMRGWANDGQIDLEHAAKADRLRTAEALHACLGTELARLIVAATRS